ncbi:recombinase family protein [Anaerosalibacter bizertensis]|uniref:Recombinase family protein n=1 Tax=Anaerosalibacter bizertensis TaxID=932217 RepID=A0A844FII9_9FIRM|nr:recombinase family protein [Anaerosalibacter bizertensis]MSS43780.1 recombinase family protein [Anaerosalibacter bizertensis]
MGKIYGYTRVSTKKQLDNNSLEQQEKEILQRYADAEIYKEQFTGTSIDRPVFNTIIKELDDSDTLVCTKLDRFCRTTKEGLELIDVLMNRGVRVHILNMGLIEDTAMGRLIVTNLLAFAEFERNMIVERTQAGKAIAKQREGFTEGRPRRYSKVQINHALDMLQVNGGEYSYTEVEEITGISKSTLIRRQRERGLKCKARN